MPKRKPPTHRLQVMLSLKTQAYLDRLAAGGTHGTSAPDVARTMIEQGVREAIEKGFLSPADVEAVRGDAD